MGRLDKGLVTRSIHRPGIVITLVLCHAWCALGDQQVELSRLPPVDPVVVAPHVGASSETSAAVGQAVADAPTVDGMQALEADVLDEIGDESSWYDWVVPTHWHMPAAWESSFELGIDGSEGNASTLTFRAGTKLRRKVDWSDLKLAITYVKSTAEAVETKHNAQLEAHHDWLLGDSPWSIFAKSILVYDEFRPFDLELTLNAGLGYQFVETDAMSFKGRFGSGATRQWAGPDDRWRPEAMLGVDFDYKISERQKFRVTSEYFPEWGSFGIYRIRTDAGWEILLDEATNMSLKVGVIDRYDSNAGGTDPNALDYSLLLLWKL